MALDLTTLVDSMVDNLYDKSFATPTETAAAWASSLEDYIIALTPSILASEEAPTTLELTTTAFTPVFVNAPDIATLAGRMSTALAGWTAAVALTFKPPTIPALTPLAPAILAPLSAAFVLNSKLSPAGGTSVPDLQRQAVTNVATAIDTWVKTGTAQIAPGPPPVIVLWS